MKFVSNAGQARVIDLLCPWLRSGHCLGVVSPTYSVFASAEIRGDAAQRLRTRLIAHPERADLALRKRVL